MAMLLMLVPLVARAQTSGSEWERGTTIAVFGGAASAEGTTPAGGFGAGWELTPHLTLDGSGWWLGEGRGTTSFAVLLGGRVTLVPAQRVMPFLSGGFGVHHASVDLGNQDVPDFYRSRTDTGGGTLQGTQAFTDAAWAIGAGLDIIVRQHLSIRPEIRMVAVSADQRTRRVAVWGVHVAYHFEDRFVTP
ncbi:MAG: outer membrane beta-barrel protein [Acidobacteria bacterium]|nr:outer membrane beta-barrel protein [Acidobacteriota bacterium]